MKQVFVAAAVVLGALGFSTVAMASGRASSPAADGSAETHSLAKNPHAVTDGLNAGPTSARSVGMASRGAMQRSSVGAGSTSVRALHMSTVNGARTSSASSFSSSRSSRTR